jgi:hypothetical protein
MAVVNEVNKGWPRTPVFGKSQEGQHRVPARRDPVSNMRMADAKRPRLIAIKETAKAGALALVSKGYDQIREAMDCPRCALRFLLLLDSNDPAVSTPQSASRAVDRFRQVIVTDHNAGHPHDCLFLGNEPE